jgi:hypothetical protein
MEEKVREKGLGKKVTWWWLEDLHTHEVVGREGRWVWDVRVTIMQSWPRRANLTSKA